MSDRPLCVLTYSSPLPTRAVAAEIVRDALRDQLRSNQPGAQDAVFPTHAGNVVLLLVPQPVPLPSHESMTDIAQRAAWGGSGIVEESTCWRGHAMVSAMEAPSSLPMMRNLARNVLRAAAALAADTGAVAANWTNAGLFHPTAAFVAAARRAPLPSDLLVRCTWYDAPGPAGSGMGAVTCGLGLFGLPEFCHPPTGEDPSAIYDRLLNLATYVIGNGPVLKDGDTFGIDDRAQARIRQTRGPKGEPTLTITRAAA